MMMESIAKAKKRRKNPAWSGLILWQGNKKNFLLAMIVGLSPAIISTVTGRCQSGSLSIFVIRAIIEGGHGA